VHGHAHSALNDSDGVIRADRALLPVVHRAVSTRQTIRPPNLVTSLMAVVMKTTVAEGLPGFESLSLRQPSLEFW
jgi:hypothetical protein